MGTGGTIVHLLLPPLGTRAGGMDVHSSDLYDWGQWRDHLHTGTGRALSLSKTSTGVASPPESARPRVARADYLTSVTRREDEVLQKAMMCAGRR